MRQLILQILREETQPLHEDKITQVVNSLLKKYIPDNSTFETWFSTPYDDNERVDVYIEYSFDEKDTYFWKTDVEEDDDDDEPQRYEEDDKGIVGTFKIARTNAGDDALAEAQEGLRTGFSVGAMIDDYVTKGEQVIVNEATLREVSHVTFPAFE